MERAPARNHILPQPEGVCITVVPSLQGLSTLCSPGLGTSKLLGVHIVVQADSEPSDTYFEAATEELQAMRGATDKIDTMQLDMEELKENLGSVEQLQAPVPAGLAEEAMGGMQQELVANRTEASAQVGSLVRCYVFVPVILVLLSSEDSLQGQLAKSMIWVW